MTSSSRSRSCLPGWGPCFLFAILAAAGVLGLALSLGNEPKTQAQASGPLCSGDPHHLSWVWQFSTDGSPQNIAGTLAANHLGVLVKTHDGLDWMSRYDRSPSAVSGPAQVRTLAQFFESRQIPFHAWAVVKGIDPIAEAQMAAAVLEAGARSIVFDLEPWAGFWVGTPEGARLFGQELRRLQPNAVIATAIDPRPWILPRIPLAEFASFSNILAPLIYWDTFNSPGNAELYAANGWPPGPQGITPEFVLDVSVQLLAPLNRTIQPAGQGASQDSSTWSRFLDGVSRWGLRVVSAWRYGVTNPQVFSILKEHPPCDFIVHNFQPWPGYGIPLGSWQSGDFNGDGKTDLLHLTPFDYVQTWLSKGDGSFAVAFFRPWPGYAVQWGSWQTGDFNGDGKTDLLHLTPSDYVLTWLSKGDGSFNVAFFQPWPGYNISLGSWEIGDFNNDSKTDLLHLTPLDYVHTWLSKGDGSFNVGFFQPWPGYNISLGSWQIGDFNNDSKTDLLHLTPFDYVHTWLSKGDGSFAVAFFRPWPGYAIQWGSWQTGDFNGDGKTDLIHLTPSDYVLTWRSLSNGAFDVGFFQPWPGYAVHLGSWQTGDFNGDGKTDLIHLTPFDYVHTWLSLGNGAFGIGFFQPWPGYPISQGPWRTLDFNGDGKDDLIQFTPFDFIYTWRSF